MGKRFLLTFVLALTAIGGLVFWLNKKQDFNLFNQNADIKSAFNKPAGLIAGADEIRKEEGDKQLEAIESGRVKTYSDPELGFSFDYPDSFNVGSYDEDAGKVIILQNNNVGFQLYITPFDEADTVITPERLKQDIPDLSIEEPIQIAIDKAIGLVFLSDSESLGKTREIWWVHQSHLYQITTYTEFDNAMVEILKSWVFN
ncbi:MAG: hypothetical protein Q8Q06_02790 [bacterium]|nr:hypothetical protein [bacterium]